MLEWPYKTSFAMNPVYIYDALRTPLEAGLSGGAYREIRPLDLLRQTLLVLSKREFWRHVPPSDFILGCATPVGDLGKNIARAALLHAGMHAISGVQLNRFDLSGLDAVGWAMARIGAGMEAAVLAGGLCLQSSLDARQDRGAWTDDPDMAILPTGFPPVFSADLQSWLDALDADGLEAYAKNARSRGQDISTSDFSYLFPILDDNGLTLIDQDRLPEASETSEGLPLLPEVVYQRFLPLAQKKYFHLEHFPRIHAASTAAAPADGLGLLLLGGEPTTAARVPLARIRAYVLLESAENLPFAGMTQAAEAALARSGLSREQIDLWACDEPFAGIALAFQRSMQLDPERLNVSGGNLVFGRPAAANGSYLLIRMLEDLKNKQLSFGLLALADHSGSSGAIIVENLG